MYFCSAETWDSGLGTLWLFSNLEVCRARLQFLFALFFSLKITRVTTPTISPSFLSPTSTKKTSFSQPRHMQHPSECVRADPSSARAITVLIWSPSCPAAQNKLGITTRFLFPSKEVILPLYYLIYYKHFPFVYHCPSVGKHRAPPPKLWQLSDWPEALAILHRTMTWNQTSLLQIIPVWNVTWELYQQWLRRAKYILLFYSSLHSLVSTGVKTYFSH